MTIDMGPGSRSRCIAAVALLALVGVSCGTRVSDQEQAAPLSSGAPGSIPVLEGSGDAAVASDSGGAPQAVTESGSSAAGAPVSPQQRSTAVAAGTGGGAATPKNPSVDKPGVGTVKANPAPVPGGATTPATPDRSASSPGTPIVLASVGPYSGPIGVVVRPLLEGTQVWVKAINARGGLAGHPVELVVYDDGGDPARHRGAVQEAVERRKVIAFLSLSVGASGSAGSSDYITSKRVPVIGGDGSGADGAYYVSPMFFPQVSSDETLYLHWVASAVRQGSRTGKKKVASIYCAEATPCTRVGKAFSAYTAAFGGELVYTSQASLVQPDYTAECLNASRAGAEIVNLALDTNSFGRFASSCRRQGYRPIFSTGGPVLQDRLAEDPNFDGLIGASTSFPWFQSGTPASDEFQRAMAQFGKGLVPGTATAQGWTSGKLLERVVAKAGDPTTSNALLEGLWSIKDDTLGGLTYPLTYVRDQPAARTSCGFDLVIKGGKWASPDGYQLHCQDFPK